MFWSHETKSATAVQRNFRTEYSKDPPSWPTTFFCHQTFVETCYPVRHAKSTGRLQISDAVVEQFGESNARSPKKSR